MKEAQFNQLAAEGYNRIPVTLETFADLDTPLSIYLKLANAPQIVIFGGAEIYAAALPLADRIEWTEVHAEPDGDTRFPAFDRSEWTETFRESHPAEGRSPAFDFVTLVRKPSSKQEG